MREPSSCGIRRAEGETGAGRVALVWNYILQPSARPQGVPVGPQSTCHAPDRGASTMLIPSVPTRVNRKTRTEVTRAILGDTEVRLTLALQLVKRLIYII